MKRAVLLLTVFLPLVLAAQENGPGANSNQAKSASALRAASSSSSDPISLADSNNGAGIGFGVDADSQQPPSARPSQSADPRGKPKLNIPGSVVGYVDSAIVGNQIRIRFDDAFHNNAPDRAEFFYAQCSCTNLTPRAPGPDFPGASNYVNFQQVYLQAEYAPVGRFSIFLEAPFRWIAAQPNSFIANSYTQPPDIPSTATNAGISDVRAGIKLALATSSRHSLTAQVRAYFPSGSGSLGLGTAHYSVEPSLLYYQRLSQKWAVESQLGDWHPIGGSMGVLNNFAGDVFLYGVGPSYRLIDGEHFKLAPVIELFGWRVLGGLQTTPPFPVPPGDCSLTVLCSQNAGGTNIVNLKAGVRTSFGGHNSVYIGFGQAVTNSVWYQHIVRIEYRISF